MTQTTQRIKYIHGRRTIIENVLPNGKRHGRYREWYRFNQSGNIKIECNYKNGKVGGLYKQWYMNRRREEESNWKDGKKHGSYKVWYPLSKGGDKWEESNYKDGKLHGICKEWFQYDTKCMESNYKDGERLGVHYMGGIGMKIIII